MEFKIGRFGTDEADLITQDVIEGSIIQMTDRVVEILKTKYLTSPIHYEGLQRIETLEVPENALREILYNAIAHKDYMGAPIQMRVWDDHIEIWNEGALPDGILVRDLLGLDVVLLHFPGHLATAVKFKSNVEGDYLDLDDGRYIVCDPTYIGAPVGVAMPDCKTQEVRVFPLK